jgi:hypothetical protein
MEAVMAVISSKNLTLCLCKSAERLWTLRFSNSPIKINHKPTDQAKGWSRNVTLNVVSLGESIFGLCKVDSQPQVCSLIKSVRSWTLKCSELISILTPCQTEHCVIQNNERKLSHSVGVTFLQTLYYNNMSYNSR